MGSLQRKLQGRWTPVILFSVILQMLFTVFLHAANTVSAINPRKKKCDFFSAWKTVWELLFFSILHRKRSLNSVEYFSESLEKRTLSYTSVKNQLRCRKKCLAMIFYPAVLSQRILGRNSSAGFLEVCIQGDSEFCLFSHSRNAEVTVICGFEAPEALGFTHAHVQVQDILPQWTNMRRKSHFFGLLKYNSLSNEYETWNFLTPENKMQGQKQVHFAAFQGEYTREEGAHFALFSV